MEEQRAVSRRQALGVIGVTTTGIWAAPAIVTYAGHAGAFGSPGPATTTQALPVSFLLVDNFDSDAQPDLIARPGATTGDAVRTWEGRWVEQTPDGRQSFAGPYEAGAGPVLRVTGIPVGASWTLTYLVYGIGVLNGDVPAVGDGISLNGVTTHYATVPGDPGATRPAVTGSLGYPAALDPSVPTDAVFPTEFRSGTVGDSGTLVFAFAGEGNWAGGRWGLDDVRLTVTAP